MKRSFAIISAFFSLFCGLSSAALAGNWVIEFPDGRLGCYDPTLRLDASGGPHIAYTDEYGHVRYVEMDGESWKAQVVGSGWRASMGLDSDGTPHISYCTRPGSRLNCATPSGAGWSTESIDMSSAPWWTSTAVDSAGSTHIAYLDNTLGDLMYATNSGGTWTTETLDGSDGYNGYSASLALDSSNNPHIAYLDSSANRVKYVYKSGDSWVSEIVDSFTGAYCEGSSLALDAQGNPYISYFDRQNRQLKYAYRDGASWVTQVVASSDGQYSSIAIDSLGRPHIAYGAGLQYASLTGSSWTSVMVDPNASDIGVSLVLDGADMPHMAYYSNGYMAYASYVPEPSTIAVLLWGLAGLGGLVRRRKPGI